MMDYADSPLQGDLDGRGNLSRRALSDFIAWFLKVCLDQVTFMDGLFELDSLVERLKIYAERRGFRPEALYILEEALQRGGFAARGGGPGQRVEGAQRAGSARLPCRGWDSGFGDAEGAGVAAVFA